MESEGGGCNNVKHPSQDSFTYNQAFSSGMLEKTRVTRESIKLWQAN